MSLFYPLFHKGITFFYISLQRDGIRRSRISFLSRLFFEYSCPPFASYDAYR